MAVTRRLLLLLSVPLVRLLLSCCLACFCCLLLALLGDEHVLQLDGVGQVVVHLLVC